MKTETPRFDQRLRRVDAQRERTPALRFANVTQRYGSHLALDDLGFEVARGETLAFLGPNGAGKSTTISLLLGLLRPDSGSVEVLGTTPRSRRRSGPRRRHAPDRLRQRVATRRPGRGGVAPRAAPVPASRPVRPDRRASRHRAPARAPDAPPFRRGGPAGSFRNRHRRQPGTRLSRRADRCDGRRRPALVLAHDPPIRPGRANDRVCHTPSSGGRRDRRPGRRHQPRPRGGQRARGDAQGSRRSPPPALRVRAPRPGGARRARRE